KSGRGGYWFGGTVVAIGVICAIAGLVVGFVSLFTGPNVTFTGSTTIELTANESKVVYVDDDVARVRCASSGAAELREYPGSLQINDWYGVYVLSAPTSGSYTVTCESSYSDTEFGIGPRMSSGAKTAMIVGPAVGLLLVVVGFVLIILTARRNRRRRPNFPPQPTSA
ncbi:hypothetical protein GOEFS_084_00010, partial [Gordonia effusa NBRC 100432]